MAQQGKKKRPTSGNTPAGGSGRTGSSGTSGSSGSQPDKAAPKAPTGAAAPRPPRTAVGNGPQGSAIRRQSVAANRTRGGDNKTQMYILLAAALVILAVIVVGMIWNKSSQTAENDGYGTSRNGVATIDSVGVITVAANDPKVTLDIYEDPICPFCGAFERQFGQLIAQSIDEGKVAVNYHVMNFLDNASGSGSYSTRASAALMCAASTIGSTPGAWSALHSTLYSIDVQPTEGSTSDLSNDELNSFIAQAATGAGLAADAPSIAAAQSCVRDGAMLDTVTTSFEASAAVLTELTGAVRSPVIASNGRLVNVDEPNWLATLTG